VIGPRTPRRGALPPAGPVARELKRVLVKVNSSAPRRTRQRSASRHIEPEIDLKGPPTDPGVSREHAKLIAGPDRSWSVVDLGSTSGTLADGSEITPGEAVPLRDGNRINLGAWTMITMART
jgi:pSer/pThr/pTyr-binding forkhead associated (FHA) protein